MRFLSGMVGTAGGYRRGGSGAWLEPRCRWRPGKQDGVGDGDGDGDCETDPRAGAMFRRRQLESINAASSAGRHRLSSAGRHPSRLASLSRLHSAVTVQSACDIAAGRAHPLILMYVGS